MNMDFIKYNGYKNDLMKMYTCTDCLNIQDKNNNNNLKQVNFYVFKYPGIKIN